MYDNTWFKLKYKEKKLNIMDGLHHIANIPLA
jgi:hypothetical protein